MLQISDGHNIFSWTQLTPWKASPGSAPPRHRFRGHRGAVCCPSSPQNMKVQPIGKTFPWNPNMSKADSGLGFNLTVLSSSNDHQPEVSSLYSRMIQGAGQGVDLQSNALRYVDCPRYKEQLTEAFWRMVTSGRTSLFSVLFWYLL